MPLSLPRKDLFHLPEGVIYLDGNSLGPLPNTAIARAESVMRDEWGNELIRAWNSADWMAMPEKVGNQIAPLIGAPHGSVVTGDTLSIKVFQSLTIAVGLRPERRVILSDTTNFPSDLYMADGLIRLLGKGYELRTVPPEDIPGAITEDVAAVLLTHVNYRTGAMFDMARVTAKAHAAGAVMIWDLAHSTGAVPVDLAGCTADLAVGCTYKFLNGGPGSPGFIYARPDLIETIQPALAGWLGHAAPFAMEPTYHPAASIERLRIGTPAIIQLAILEEALKIWADIDMQELRASSVRLSELFLKEVAARCPQLNLASPADPALRGSQVCFAFEHGYEVMQALIAEGVIGDYRTPDIMRFGITPLYLADDDILQAVDILSEIMGTERWREPQFAVRARVT